MDKPFFLISLNVDAHGSPVQYVTTYDQWHHILTTARANGWEPQGTILDYEFHYQLEASKYVDLNQEDYKVIERQVRDVCRGWQGDYLTSEYQIVTDEDIEGMMTALGRTTAPLALLSFLSYGAFRIAG